GLRGLGLRLLRGFRLASGRLLGLSLGGRFGLGLLGRGGVRGCWFLRCWFLRCWFLCSGLLAGQPLLVGLADGEELPLQRLETSPPAPGTCPRRATSPPSWPRRAWPAGPPAARSSRATGPPRRT